MCITGAKTTCPQLTPLPPIAEVKREAAVSQKTMVMNNLEAPCQVSSGSK